MTFEKIFNNYLDYLVDDWNFHKITKLTHPTVDLLPFQYVLDWVGYDSSLFFEFLSWRPDELIVSLLLQDRISKIFGQELYSYYYPLIIKWSRDKFPTSISLIVS